MRYPTIFKLRRYARAIAMVLFCSYLLPAGCKKETANGLTRIRVGYIGLTCEAPIFTAYEKGFFTEEGLEVEMVKCDWATYKDVFALGRFDITHHLIMYFLKPIEQGLDVKFTAGIHRGCLRVQAGASGNIHSVSDLRGKRIGVPGMGTPPFIFANRVLGTNGINPSKDVEWRVFPAGELGLALDKGEVDAVANAEPIGSLLLAEGKVRNIADQATDEKYRDEYCCAVAVNGKFLAANPKAAAAATRALLKGAKWVDTNPAAAARLSVEKKYLASNPELNAVALSHLRYLPSVSGAEEAVKSAAHEMQVAGMLSPNTNLSDLSQRAFAHLDGVTDEWVKNLKVEKLANAQANPSLDLRIFADAILGETRRSCCISSGK
ncbi:MAG TPA: ABC transporter substrate-binding protein [Tepidisphaeraceae bacterium]|jgi:NitT/TauT family transport system substrate-binding protein